MILSGADPHSILTAARCIKAGGLVGFPTETVYGLGADASNDQAVAGIFAAKGRPADHPLIVHVADVQQVEVYASSVPPFAARLMQAFWPGPLTVILPRKEGVAAAAAGGQNSVGLRCPDHPVALAFLKACNTGVAGPSANRFGRVSPTTAQHVSEEFGDQLLVLDGGPCEVGIESSIVDCTRSRPVLLRPGVLSRTQLEAACGEPVSGKEELPQAESGFGNAPRASGTLSAHYAPNAKVRLMQAGALQAALDLLGTDAAHIAVYARAIVRIKSEQVVYRRMPDDAAATAQQLFAVLRNFDVQNVKLIWIESVPATAEWEGVRDRLERAAAS
jgi:L-threonylcarbamoyladenylate synthase